MDLMIHIASSCAAASQPAILLHNCHCVCNCAQCHLTASRQAVTAATVSTKQRWVDKKAHNWLQSKANDRNAYLITHNHVMLHITVPLHHCKLHRAGRHIMATGPVHPKGSVPRECHSCALVELPKSSAQVFPMGSLCKGPQQRMHWMHALNKRTQTTQAGSTRVLNKACRILQVHSRSAHKQPRRDQPTRRCSIPAQEHSPPHANDIHCSVASAEAALQRPRQTAGTASTRVRGKRSWEPAGQSTEAPSCT